MLTDLQSSTSEGDLPRTDVHHHFLPPQYLKEGPPAVKMIRATEWSPNRALSDMDSVGVGCAMLSFSSPYIWFPGLEQGRRLARLCNDYCAQMVRDHPTRFGVFAGIPPLDDSEGCLREIEYAYDTLHVDGITVMTSYMDKWLGDSSFVPAWEELNRRGAVVFVHPSIPSCCSNISGGVPPGYVELPFDTTRTITNLWFTGSLARWSRIRFIFSHGGGALPMVADRIHKLGRPAKQEGMPVVHDALEQFQELYFDTANATSPPALSALRALANPKRILFGTDYPYVPLERGVSDLSKYLSKTEIADVMRNNARALIPSLAV